MAESSKTPQRAAGSEREVSDWESLAPVAVDYEDALGSSLVQSVWNDMYAKAGLRAPTEVVQKSFRLAVYTYAAINGTSREGAYAGEIVMSNGHKFDASVIVLATGKMRIRKFFRGNMKESYEALKRSRVLERDDRFVAKVAQFGVSANNAFATADWFSNCPHFTPSERLAYDTTFNYGISRARRNRGGVNLEEVEADRVDDRLKVQGAFDSKPHGGAVEF